MKLRVLTIVVGMEDDAADPALWEWRKAVAGLVGEDVASDYKVLSVMTPSVEPVPCAPAWKLREQNTAMQTRFPVDPENIKTLFH